MRNRRYAAGEALISPSMVLNLRLKWQFNAGKDISATPTILGGRRVIISFHPFLFTVKKKFNYFRYKQNLQELTGLNATGIIFQVNWTVSRATPTITNDLLAIRIYGPALVIAVKCATGKLVWSTKLDSHFAVVITISGTFHQRAFYEGVPSLEEGVPIETCCTFRGSLVKLDIKTGTILWQTFMLPDNHSAIGEYAGSAIWASSPSITVRRNLVFIATGNLYSAPQEILDCQEKQNNQTVPTHADACLEPDNHSNSILALDLDSGKIKWHRQLGGYDIWFVACSIFNEPNPPNCPPRANPDADFGEVAMMLSVPVNGSHRDIVAAVRKSGFAWALDRDNGNLIWSTVAGSGGVSGGGTWGAATDEQREYTNIVNSQRKNFTLWPSNKTTNSSGWVAMDSGTGGILWSTADSCNATTNRPMTVANGVVFEGSTHKTGPFYAMNAETGVVLWSYET
ncbi:Polyvinyl alcohol dehydrogenase (cytochrome) [Bertholletia excelsa]